MQNVRVVTVWGGRARAVKETGTSFWQSGDGQRNEVEPRRPRGHLWRER